MSDLDRQFEEVIEQLNAKLKDATIALKEANALKKKAGLQSLIYTADNREKAYNKHYKLLKKLIADDDDLEEAIEEACEQERANYNRIQTEELEREMCAAGWRTSSSYC